MGRTLIRLTATAVIILAALSVSDIEARGRKAKARTSESVRTEQRDNARSMDRARKRIDDVNRQTRRRLDDLSVIDHEIALGNAGIARLRALIDSTDRQIAAAADSIARLTDRAVRLDGEYGRSLRSMRDRRRTVDAFAFIFSSKTFHQAWRRINYLQEFNRRCRSKRDEIKRNKALLEEQHKALTDLRDSQNANMARLAASKTALERRKAEGDAAVAELRRENKSLQDELSRRRDIARRLSAELDRIIEAETRAAAERREQRRREQQAAEKAPATKPKAPKQAPKNDTPAKKPAPEPAQEPERRPKPVEPVAGSFARNKGRLIAPVEGSFRVVGNFGKGSHSSLSNIIVDNPGVDLETAAGSDAFAVYDGVVSSIFFLDGYRNVVIVRHGDYLTVYGGLESLKVRKGDRVARGQSIGRIAADADNPAAARLHFEVRHEKEKLNPLDWLAR